MRSIPQNISSQGKDEDMTTQQLQKQTGICDSFLRFWRLSGEGNRLPFLLYRLIFFGPPATCYPTTTPLLSYSYPTPILLLPYSQPAFFHLTNCHLPPLLPTTLLPAPLLPAPFIPFMGSAGCLAVPLLPAP
jgi:hypothetical protein